MQGCLEKEYSKIGSVFFSYFAIFLTIVQPDKTMRFDWLISGPSKLLLYTG